jgi:hypothetical protein
MADTVIVGKIEQVNRAAEVYFYLNQFATDMQIQISYNHRFELRDTLQNFKRCMIELYYIVRYNKALSTDVKLKRDLEIWIADDCARPISLSYCRRSLKLFDKFTEKLAMIGVVER